MAHAIFMVLTSVGSCCAGGNLGTSHSMLNLYNKRTSVAEGPPHVSTAASLPSCGGEVFGQLWDT